VLEEVEHPILVVIQLFQLLLLEITHHFPLLHQKEVEEELHIIYLKIMMEDQVEVVDFLVELVVLEIHHLYHLLKEVQEDQVEVVVLNTVEEVAGVLLQWELLVRLLQEVMVVQELQHQFQVHQRLMLVEVVEVVIMAYLAQVVLVVVEQGVTLQQLEVIIQVAAAVEAA
jgi:hypothetical protein